MRKKALCALLSVAMMASMFTACGDEKKEEGSTSNPTKAAENNGGENNGGESTDPTEPVEDKTDWKVSDDGKVLNIYCWNTEFQSRVKDHYAGYEEVDETTS